jgi:archaellum component FlaF (FlaF/FlaG flagellin family)
MKNFNTIFNGMMASAMFLLVSFVGSLILLAVIYFNSQEESDAAQQYLNVTLPNVIASLEDVANVSATYPVDIDDSNSLMFTLDNGTSIVVVINPNFDINGAKVKTNANIHPAEPIAYCFVKEDNTACGRSFNNNKAFPELKISTFEAYD